MQKPCYFFQQGTCKNDESCRFLHGPYNPPQLVTNNKTNQKYQPQSNTPNTTYRQKFQQPCTFFQNGLCKKGNYCEFSHDAQLVTPKLQTRSFIPVQCSFYQKGLCKNGVDCRFQHTEKKMTQQNEL